MNDESKEVNRAVDQITRALIDEGLLVETGWRALRHMAYPADASAVQLREYRRAFFCGAQHLFASIMGMLDPDAEPTAEDLRRMSNISEELRAFVEEIKREAKP